DPMKDGVKCQLFHTRPRRTIMSAQDNAFHQTYSDTTNRKRGLKFLPALGVFILIGLSLYAAQTDPQAVKTAQAKAAEQKADDKASAATIKAVAAGKKFLESLDDKQRAKAVFDFASPKKSGWS